MKVLSKPLLSILLLAVVFLNGGDCGRILTVEFFGTKSHVITYIPLLEKLAEKGHEVVLLSPLMGQSNGAIKEMYTFDMNSVLKDMSSMENITMFEMKEKNIMGTNPFTMITEVLPKHCSNLYDRKDIKELMEEEFDLVILQPMMNECAFGLVHKVMQKKNAPLVLFSPVSAPAFLVSKLGGHHPSSFVPNLFLGYSDEMTFLERFKNVGANLFLEATFNFYYVPVMEKIYRDKLGQDYPSSNEMFSKASLLLSNSHYSLARPKPNLPDVVDVGGIHSREARPLPKNLEKFVSGSGEHGFILFSLGTGLKSSEMSLEKRNLFFKVFGSLKQRVVWKFEDPSIVPLVDIPPNVMLMKWVPQMDLLGHKGMRLFITHCGLGGTEEAIFHGVPMLGIPFFGDQPLNAREGLSHGYLHVIEWNDLSEKLLADGVKEVLENSKYKTSVQRLSKMFRDQIDDPLERGLWWVEYVMRHKGAPQLRSASRKLNFIQYHCVDVLGAYLLLLFLALYLPFMILRFICRKLCSKSKKNSRGANSAKHLNGLSNGNGAHKKTN